MTSEEIIKTIKDLLNECHSVKEHYGICKFAWKHDDCNILMKLLYLVTNEDKYKDEIYFY